VPKELALEKTFRHCAAIHQFDQRAFVSRAVLVCLISAAIEAAKEYRPDLDARLFDLVELKKLRKRRAKISPRDPRRSKSREVETL